MTLGSGRRKRALLTSTTLVSVHFTGLPPTVPVSTPLPRHPAHLQGAREGAGQVSALPPSPASVTPPALSPASPSSQEEAAQKAREPLTGGGEGAFLPRLPSPGEASWANDWEKNKGELSAGERMFTQVSRGWTVGGSGEREGWGGGAEQPLPPAEAQRQRLEEPGANPVPLRGRKREGATCSQWIFSSALRLWPPLAGILGMVWSKIISSAASSRGGLWGVCTSSKTINSDA